MVTVEKKEYYLLKLTQEELKAVHQLLTNALAGDAWTRDIMDSVQPVIEALADWI